MAEVDNLKQDLNALKVSVNEQFDGVRNDLKELTSALRDLIRLDGDIKRVQDAVHRIGTQVDDHETRLRGVETVGSVNHSRTSAAEKLIYLGLLAASNMLQFFLLH
jgi:hypothetical protein